MAVRPAGNGPGYPGPSAHGAEIDRRGIPMAILAGEKAGELTYAGGAVIALRGAERDRLAALLDRFSTDRSMLRLKRPGA